MKVYLFQLPIIIIYLIIHKYFIWIAKEPGIEKYLKHYALGYSASLHVQVFHNLHHIVWMGNPLNKSGMIKPHFTKYRCCYLGSNPQCTGYSSKYEDSCLVLATRPTEPAKNSYCRYVHLCKLTDLNFNIIQFRCEYQHTTITNLHDLNHCNNLCKYLN